MGSFWLSWLPDRPIEGGIVLRPIFWFRRSASSMWRLAALGGCVGFLVGWGAKTALATAPSPPVRIIRSVPVSAKVVALTFDDGPSPQYTPQILQLLQQYGAKATFFVVGQQLVRYPAIAREEYQDGMELGNHGFRHLSLIGMDPTAIEAEVKPVEQEITAITGQRPTLYRLPQGKGDAVANRTLADMGYTVIYWNVDTRDYLESRTAAQIASTVLKRITPGSIVIFHDGGGNQQHTVDALKTILPALGAEGYKEVTVSQLLELASASPSSAGA